MYPRLTALMSFFSLTQVVSQNTGTHFGPHGHSLIDLVLLSQPNQLQSCPVHPPLGNSDHHGIILSLRWRLLCKSVASKQRSVWRCKHADFTRSCSLLNSVDWDQVLAMNMNLSWDIWRNKFMEVMEHCIPRGTLPERRNLPWLNKSIVQAIKRRNCLIHNRILKILGWHWSIPNFVIRSQLSWDRQSKVISGGWRMLAAETFRNHKNKEHSQFNL